MKVGHYYQFYRNEKGLQNTKNNCIPLNWITLDEMDKILETHNLPKLNHEK